MIKIFKDQEVPADCLIVGLPHDNKVCYMQTTNLDGETNLKDRNLVPLVQRENHDSLEDKLQGITGHILLDQPNSNIYSINGFLNLSGGKEKFIEIDNFLLRSTFLRNIDWVIGLVVYTGRDTKILQNIKRSQVKISDIDRKINKMMILLVILVAMLTITITMIGFAFKLVSSPDYAKGDLNSEYIYYSSSINNEDDVTLEILKLFASYYYIFNTIVPISLLINFDSIKATQVVMFLMDREMKKAKNEQFKVLNLKIQEDLGNVEYIFTDKTGTLTKNSMKLKNCAILTETINELKDENESFDIKNKVDEYNRNNNIALCNEFNKEKMLSLLHDESTIPIPNCPFSSWKQVTIDFLLNMALNHSVLTEYDDVKRKIVYQGNSPDEVALVQSAGELGVELMDKYNENIKLRIGSDFEIYEVLTKFEFTSSRMRSSIIVRDEFDIIKVFSKGADIIMLDRLNSFSSEQLIDSIKENAGMFAKEGLRTLCFCVKQLPNEYFYAWKHEYDRLKEEVVNDPKLSEKINEMEEEIESELNFVGITALDDELQDNVKTCIRDFMDAGIKVWMITGDKLDTAESIGFSCRLFNDNTEIFKVKSGSVESTRKRLEEILIMMEELENEEQNEEEQDKIGFETIMKSKTNDNINFINRMLLLDKEEDQTRKVKNSTGSIKPITTNTNYVFNHENMQAVLNNQDFIIEKKDINSNSLLVPLEDKKVRPISANVKVKRNITSTPNEQSVMNFMEKNKYFENSMDKSDKSNGVYSRNNSIDYNPKVSEEKKQEIISREENVDIRTKIKEIKAKLIALKTNYDDKQLNYGLIVESSSISNSIGVENQELFWKVAQKCKSVICCRCAPIQKADVVQFVNGKISKMTLAIGDGGNDVNMIKAANIGVGIFGKEGHQAAYNSDFAISKFDYLRRLLFFHGRYSLKRNNYFIYIFMHKNILFSIPQLWYSLFTGFSGTVNK